MKLSIGASRAILEGPKETLAHIDEHFSFRNKAVEGQLRRLKRTIFTRERQFHGEMPPKMKYAMDAQLEELKSKLDVKCCEWMGDSLIVPTGLVPSLVDLMKAAEIHVTVEDKRDWDDRGRRSLTGQKPDYLRTPQKEGLSILMADTEAYKKGVGLLRIATGCGKTLLAQELIRNRGVRSIFLVPSNAILKQTVRRFEKAFGAKNVRTFGGGKKDIGYVTVATYHSVFRAAPEDFDEVTMAIMDEVHHVGAETFFDVATNKLRNCLYRYGLTAYEERADGGTMLVEAAAGPVIYSYDVVQGIKEGYLAKPTFMIYSVFDTDGEWTRYKEVKGKREAVEQVKSINYDGDDNLTAYRHWISGNDKLNSSVASMTEMFVADGKSVLILVDEIDHGERLQKLMPDAGFVIGGGKDNEMHMAEFNKRKLKILIGTSTIGEGADTVPVDVLINLMGGASISQTKQAAGRALRNEEDENGVPQKPEALVIDFDFPMCRMLTRHSGIREKVYEDMGDVHKGNLP